MNKYEHCGKDIDTDNMVIDEGRTFHMLCHSVVVEEAKRAEKLRHLSEYSIKTYGDLKHRDRRDPHRVGPETAKSRPKPRKSAKMSGNERK